MIGHVYFVQVGRDGPIKIGFSKTDPVRRMGQLQTGCPWPLRLIGSVPGTKFNEKWLQEKSSPFLIRQEWFRPELDVSEILSPTFAWPAPTAPVDRAIWLAGSFCELEKATGCHQPTISASRRSGKVPKRIQEYLSSQAGAA